MWHTLRLVVSAGIAFTKPLAKLGSARHKPNNQTVIFDSGVARVMETTRLTAIGGLGGKWGEQMLAQMRLGDDAYASACCKYTRRELVAMLGSERGAWLHDVVHGECSDNVCAGVCAHVRLGVRVGVGVDV